MKKKKKKYHTISKLNAFHDSLQCIDYHSIDIGLVIELILDIQLDIRVLTEHLIGNQQQKSIDIRGPFRYIEINKDPDDSKDQQHPSNDPQPYTHHEHNPVLFESHLGLELILDQVDDGVGVVGEFLEGEGLLGEDE